MKNPAFALNRIHRTGDDGNLQIVNAGDVFEATTKEVKGDGSGELERLGAARKADAGEVANWKEKQDRANGVAPASADTPLTELTSTPEAPAPDSGATGDPNAKPRGRRAAKEEI